MRFSEFKETNLNEAPLGTTGLFKYIGRKNDRVPIFLQKIKNGTPFLIKTKTGTEEVVIDPTEYDKVESWIKSPTPNLRLKSTDGRIIPFGSIVKTKEFGGEVAGQRERVEQGQIEGVQIELDKIKAGKPFTKLKVGDKTVNAARVEKEQGTVNGRAPKSDMTVLDENNEPVAWVSLKGSAFRWGGWQHLSNLPEIKDWLNRIKQVNDGIFEPGQAFGLHISEDVANKIVYGKAFGGDRGISNVDAVLIGWADIKGNVLTADRVYSNGETPKGIDKPYLVMRYMLNRNDLGFKNVRAETNTVSEGRKVKWLDTDADIESAKLMFSDEREYRAKMSASPKKQQTLGNKELQANLSKSKINNNPDTDRVIDQEPVDK